MAVAFLRGFRPHLWPSLIAGAGVLLMLGLGSWQVARLFEKRETNALRAERLAAAPAPLPARLDDPARWEFRRVTLRGRFAHERELYLPCRSQHGNDGTCVLTPLLRDDGGAPVLVNRGWVPPPRKDPARRAAGQAAGDATVEGVLRVAQQRSWAMPDNAPERNVWFWYELPAMARATGLPLATFYVEAAIDPAAPEGAPLGGQTRYQLPDNHLGYALTWYALAIAFAVIYVMSQRQPPETPPA